MLSRACFSTSASLSAGVLASRSDNGSKPFSLSFAFRCFTRFSKSDLKITGINSPNSLKIAGLGKTVLKSISPLSFFKALIT